MNIIIYATRRGREPFTRWLESLDKTIQARVLVRLDRLASGHMGETRDLGEGLFELKFSMRSGYRIFFAREGDQLLILLNGGNKSSQKRDIEKAREYLLDYRNRSYKDD